MRFSFVFLSFISVHLFGQGNPKLKITHLTGNLYVFTTHRVYQGTPFPANGMYLVTDQGAVMIDSPWDTTQFQPLIDSIRRRHHKGVVMSISTHSHEDRTGGLAFLKRKGIKTYTTKQTDEISKQRKEKRAQFLISTDTTFIVGRSVFQTFYPGQGHTPDNIVIWFGKEKVLYGGCLIKSTEATDLGNITDANLNAWPTTLKSLQEKFVKVKYVIPGHQSWSNAKSLEHTLLLLEKKTQPAQE